MKQLFVAPDEMGWKPQKVSIIPADGGISRIRKPSVTLSANSHCCYTKNSNKRMPAILHQFMFQSNLFLLSVLVADAKLAYVHQDQESIGPAAITVIQSYNGLILGSCSILETAG
ncbi:hypothetical protein Ancab_014622 [Ancistrocladus abbreviatus]